jgi:hypothetical protein
MKTIATNRKYSYENAEEKYTESDIQGKELHCTYYTKSGIIYWKSLHSGGEYRVLRVRESETADIGQYKR